MVQFEPLPSPKVPLVGRHDSLVAFVAYASHSAPGRRPALVPVGRSYTAFSVAEPAQPSLIYREKELFDCLGTFNMSISLTLAVLPAVGTELIRSNILPTAMISPDDEDQPLPPEPEPFDWLLVLQNSALALARDLLSKIVQQFVEIRSKCRVPKWMHDELIKHVPTFAEKMHGPKPLTISEGFSARCTASLAVGMSKLAYANRTLGLFVADALLVDGARLLFPISWRSRLAYRSEDPSGHSFVTNLKLKLGKHALAGFLSYSIGVVTPLMLPSGVPYFIGFVCGDMVAVVVAEGLIAQVGDIKFVAG